MFSKFFLFLIIFLSSITQAKILVLEYRSFSDSFQHGFDVESLACESKENCSLYFTDTFFSPEFLDDFHYEKNKYHIINMSFFTSLPGAPIRPWDDESVRINEKSKEDYKKHKKGLIDFSTQYQDKLFVIAAGNGIKNDIHNSLGIGVLPGAEMYPVALSGNHILKVAAVEGEKRPLDRLHEYKIADYSNFSLETVDVAYPTGRSEKGEKLFGTSFSAPLISQLAFDLKAINDDLSAQDLKSVLMKSCYVKDIERAIWASKDFQKKKRHSIVFDAMYLFNRAERIKKQEEVGDVMLVKCGGVVVEEVAKQCVQNSLQRERHVSLETGCLKAQKKFFNYNNNQLKQLSLLWKLRGV